MPLTKCIDVYGKGEKLQRGVCDQIPERLLIHKISPSPNSLPKHKTGYDQIQKPKKRELMIATEQNSRNQTAKNTAINGKAALINYIKCKGGQRYTDHKIYTEIHGRSTEQLASQYFDIN